MNELALFAGAGGGILGGKLLGWRTVCAVEINDHCRRVLMQRQDDGILQPFPIWDDVTTFDGRPWRGRVDVVSGGFPCQDISAAGKGAGIDGEQSGLWSEMARIIGEVRPRFAFVENSPRLTSRGLDRVLGDLSSLGYDARWGVVSAADAIWSFGTPAFDHLRERIWIVATDYTQSQRRRPRRLPIGAGKENSDARIGGVAAADVPRIQQGREEQWTQRERTRESDQPAADADSPGRRQLRSPQSGRTEQPPPPELDSWWESEPGVGRVVHGLANRVDRLAAIGNGQVPAVVALAWRLLNDR